MELQPVSIPDVHSEQKDRSNNCKVIIDLSKKQNLFGLDGCVAGPSYMLQIDYLDQAINPYNGTNASIIKAANVQSLSFKHPDGQLEEVLGVDCSDLSQFFSFYALGNDTMDCLVFASLLLDTNLEDPNSIDHKNLIDISLLLLQKTGIEDNANPGDIIIFGQQENDHKRMVHCGIYLSEGLVLQKYGIGLEIGVSSISTIRSAYPMIDCIWIAKPKQNKPSYKKYLNSLIIEILKAAKDDSILQSKI